jgi:hypothetical protein
LPRKFRRQETSIFLPPHFAQSSVFLLQKGFSPRESHRTSVLVDESVSGFSRICFCERLC